MFSVSHPHFTQLGSHYIQFKERYNNYKVPLVQLQGSGLIKTLREMGVKFKATPEQAKMLEPLSSLIEISEDSSIEESQDTEDLKEIFRTEQEEKLTQPKKTAAKEEDEDEEYDDEYDEHEDDEGDIPESSRAKAARVKKERDAKAAIDMFGKFVNVTDLFPPLPEKGDFKVEAIKASQYFFS